MPIKMLVKKSQQGMNLIEVLVAIFVLSVGLIGMASLQMTSLRANQSSYYRSQASMLAYDIADRMRGNSALAVAGDYVAVGGTFDTDGNVPGLPGCATSTTGCTDSQRVLQDLAEWSARVEGDDDNMAMLPDAQGLITREVVGGVDIFTIEVIWRENTWDEANQRNNVANESFSLDLSL